jgi:exonuclease SbcD
MLDSPSIRVLLIADTHLGFDLPFRPRVQRRRRGHDFFANVERALQPALQGEVDLVVHGGDLLYRSKVPPALVEMAMEPLLRVAEQGVPVFLVPGNHERSRIPLHLWAAHPNIHIFDRPRTIVQSTAQGTVALAGFPFARDARDRFREVMRHTGHREARADIHLLCMHQTVEGVQVGPGNYTFRAGPDVIRGREIPIGFAAVLCGHIHRAQVLRHDLGRRPLAAPVIYPGSVERTSFAERDEEKGYVLLEVSAENGGGGRLEEIRFVPLPARPMVKLVFNPGGLERAALAERLRQELAALDPDAVVRLELRGNGASEARGHLTAIYLRSLAPPSMNVTLAHNCKH